MDFPSARVVFFLVLSLYLASQLFLFFRIRNYLRSRIQDLRRQKFLTGFLILFFLLALYPLAWRAIGGLRVYEPYVWTIRSLLAVWVFGSMGSVLVLLSYDLFQRLRLLFHRQLPEPPDPGRRDFLKKSVGIAAVAPFFVSGYGVVMGRRDFEVEHFELPVSGLSSALSQLSIVQLTDIHAGPFMPEEELAAYVEAVNRLKPDLIALTGDFVSTIPDEIYPCANALGQLNSRYGIFACMGNHDVYAGVVSDLTRLFTQKGIRVLRNDAISLDVGNTKLDVLGIDDLRWGRPNLPQALKIAARKPGEVRLLLSHRPEVFPEAAQKGIDVVLSGHYHGGQVKLNPEPNSLSIARLITPYAEGLFHLSRRSNDSGQEARDSVLFVSRGIGITGLPIRVNCPPQIAHLTLKKT